MIFVTREISPMLESLLNKKEDYDLVFGTSDDEYVTTGTKRFFLHIIEKK